MALRNGDLSIREEKRRLQNKLRAEQLPGLRNLRRHQLAEFLSPRSLPVNGGNTPNHSYSNHRPRLGSKSPALMQVLQEYSSNACCIAARKTSPHGQMRTYVRLQSHSNRPTTMSLPPPLPNHAGAPSCVPQLSSPRGPYHWYHH